MDDSGESKGVVLWLLDWPLELGKEDDQRNRATTNGQHANEDEGIEPNVSGQELRAACQ